MTNDEKEKWIDEILVFMNDEAENEGAAIQLVFFNFLEEGENWLAFKEKTDISYEDFVKVANTCRTRGYFGGNSIGHGYSRLVLSESGQARAISVKNAKPQNESSTYNFGTYINNGSSQIGNYNTQTITQFFQQIEEQINNSDASAEEKAEAKNRLLSFLSHPLTQTLIGAGVTIGSTMAGK